MLPNLGQSWGHVGLQKHGFSLGLAFGAHEPAKISQHKVNFSLYRPIAACGLGGDREALTIIGRWISKLTHIVVVTHNSPIFSLTKRERQESFKKDR